MAVVFAASAATAVGSTAQGSGTGHGKRGTAKAAIPRVVPTFATRDLMRMAIANGRALADLKAAEASARPRATESVPPPSKPPAPKPAPTVTRRPVVTHRPSPPPAPRRTPRPVVMPQGVPSVATWERLASCESTDRWSINTGNGYYGGLQMDMTFWREYSARTAGPPGLGSKYPLVYARPDLAPEMAQIAAADLAWKGRGFEPWPVCSVKMGLR